MDTLSFILNKYKIDKDAKSPIRLWCSRWKSLPRLYRQLGFTLGVEIGTEVGAFAKYLVQDSPNLKLYTVDMWEPYREYMYGKSSHRQANFYKRARIKLAPYPNCQIIVDYSMGAVRRFADESLDFVFIDANHDYKFVKEDIREWSKKVRKGGLVCGHDYYVFSSGNDGVVRAVDEAVKEYKVKHLFLFNKDSCSSWFYVK